MFDHYLESLKKLAANHTARAILVIFLLTLVFYYPTWKSLVAIWTRSETFAHGYIVIPVSLWLVWQNKAIHPYLFPGKPSGWGLLFLVANGFLWLLGSLIHALVIQQYALVGLLIGAIWFYLGDKTSKKLIFPLAFLYFMVPVGEALIPYLINFTADFTIFLLRKTGLSVYREGANFSLVSGDWSVVEACSGLRYLLASFTLGTIYAYITYTKTYKRILFILCSLIFPIIANGFRAYMIVMIGHLSGMKLAVGVDHLIYGAIFFAFIIFIMFYIGSFWKDPEVKPALANDSVPPQTQASQHQSQTTLILIACLGIWPITHYWLQANYHAQTAIPEWPPLTQNPNWHEINPPAWPWRPKFDGAANESLRYFQNGDNVVGLYQVNFGDEKQGKELVNNKNVLLPGKQRKYWHIIEKNIFRNNINNAFPQSTTLTVLRGISNDIITLSWYKIGSYTTENQYIVKLLQLYKRLVLNNKPEIQYILFISSNNYHHNDQIKQFIKTVK